MAHSSDIHRDIDIQVWETLH